MDLRRCFLLSLLTFTGSGCTPIVSEHPLVDPAKAKPLPALHGVFRTEDCPDNLVHYVHIGSAGNKFPAGFLRTISVRQPKDDKTDLNSTPTVGFVQKVGDSYVLHFPIPKTAEDELPRPLENQQWDATEIAGYWIVQIRLQPDGFEMASLNKTFISSEIKAKRLTGLVTQTEIEQENGVIELGNSIVSITADSAELNKFFAKNIAGELFDKPYWKFRRVE